MLAHFDEADYELTKYVKVSNVRTEKKKSLLLQWYDLLELARRFFSLYDAFLLRGTGKKTH